MKGTTAFMFEPNSLMPHAVCWASDPKLIWTMVVTNFITFLSYLCICCTLLYLVRKTRKVIARDWGYFVVGFALFIVACGSTHLMDVITTWIPVFWIDAGTSIITAILSAYVAMMLIRRVAKIAYGVNDYGARLANAESEKHLMEERLLNSQKLQDWSRMSASVSHEIKNPLQAIQNLQFLIQVSEGASPKIVELAALAEEEAKRVVTIAESALSFIRQTTKPEPIDLRAAVESVQFLLAPLIASKSARVEIHSSGDSTVEAFAGETRQVLLNVVRNACEATTQPGQHIVVDVIGRPTSVDVVVTDHGVGIPAEVMPNIFQFGVTTKGNQGNGMGLWTVQHILNKHRGKVGIQSKPGEGTRVELTWPRAYDPRIAEALSA
jgi:signal transduction histidine kinase